MPLTPYLSFSLGFNKCAIKSYTSCEISWFTTMAVNCGLECWMDTKERMLLKMSVTVVVEEELLVVGRTVEVGGGLVLLLSF